MAEGKEGFAAKGLARQQACAATRLHGKKPARPQALRAGEKALGF
jgi:hypothetical protein